jgi:O-antigen/teichoic acid export membrane protein
MSLSLTKNSIFSASSNFLITFLRAIIAIVVTPLITRSLGVKSYGAWTIITSLFSYLSLTNLNSGSTLMIRLAAIQHDMNYEPKQKLLGAAFKLYKFSLIISFIFCYVILLLAPSLFSDNLSEIFNIRVAIFVGTIGVVVEQYGGIAGNSLRGSNLDYKGLGIRIFLIIFTNLIIILLLYIFKFGIVGLSVSTFLGSLAFSVLWFRLAKKELSWFKKQKTSIDELKTYAKQSFLTLSHSIGSFVLTNLDSLLIGIMLGSEYAAKYFLSVTLFRTLVFPLINTLNTSSAIGLAYLIGSQNWISVKSVFNELIKVSMILLGASGIFFILFNRQIIHFWVGESFYSDERLELIFVVFCLIQFIYFLIQYVADGLQMFNVKARISITLAIVFVVLAIPLLYFLKLKGILIAASLARVVGVILLVKSINKKTPEMISVKLLIRQLLVVGVILFGVYLFSKMIPELSLTKLILIGSSCALFLSFGVYIVLPGTFKQRILANLPFRKQVKKYPL